MVSPVHGDYRRYQAEIPPIVLSKFSRPALSPRGDGLGMPSSETLHSNGLMQRSK